MSAHSDLIEFFKLNATFDPTTCSTREILQSSDRANLKRQITVVREWKRKVEPVAFGVSGIVWLEHDEERKELRAVKQISKGTLTTPFTTDPQRELLALSRVSKRQDLFVHFSGWFESDNFFFLAMEYFELGDLEKFITPELTERDAKIIGRQLLEGLQVLHGYDLAHRDLKPENIFVARDSPNWWIKIGDFGFSRHIWTKQTSMLSLVGTLNYMAPEILLDNDDEEDSSYTLAIDVWSLGCVIFRLLTRRFPFPENRGLRLYWYSKISFPTEALVESDVSKDGVSFVSELMKANPADRITVTTALLHSWISSEEFKGAPRCNDSSERSMGEEPDDETPIANSAVEPHASIASEIRRSVFGINQPFSCAGNQDLPCPSIQNLVTNYPLMDSQNQKAAQLGKSMVEERKGILSDEDPETRLQNLALSYYRLGRHKEVAQLEEVLVQAQKQILGDQHPNTLISMRSLASSYNKLGRYQEGMHLNQQTLETQRRILGDEHPDTLGSMHNLALSYYKLGMNKEALQWNQQTLEARRQMLGDEHPDTLDSMRNLALSYYQLGMNKEAMQLSQQTLEAQRRILSDEHPNTLDSMHNLALSYYKLGMNKEAMQLNQQTLEARRRILGDKHPNTLGSMHNLALSYYQLGMNKEAMQLSQQTLDARRQILGDEHPDTLGSMHNLALSYYQLSMNKKAMQLNQLTPEARRQILGDEHPDTLGSVHNLASSYDKLGMNKGAMQLGQQRLGARRRILGNEHADSMKSMQNLAASYYELGMYDKATQLEELRLRCKAIH